MRFQKHPFYNDPRSKKFSHEQLFGSVSQFPQTLGRPRRAPENQHQTNRCTGYAAAVAGGYIHDMRMHPDWQAAKIGNVQGRSVDISGADPNAVMKSQRDYGYIPYTMVPPDKNLERSYPSATGMENFDSSLDTFARDNRVAGFVRPDGGQDIFDGIRSALLMAYDPTTKTGAPVQAFGTWYHEWTPAKTIPRTYQNFAGYHSYLFIDFDGDYLIAQNSYGLSAGDHGFHYFPREVVNREFAKYGTSLKIVKPLTPQQIELAKQETVFGQIQRLIIKAWYDLSNIYL